MGAFNFIRIVCRHADSISSICRGKNDDSNTPAGLPTSSRYQSNTARSSVWSLLHNPVVVLPGFYNPYRWYDGHKPIKFSDHPPPDFFHTACIGLRRLAVPPIHLPFGFLLRILEPVSKMHLTPNSCVVSLLKMLTYYLRMLRFCVGSRLDLGRDLLFLRSGSIVISLYLRPDL